MNYHSLQEIIEILKEDAKYLRSYTIIMSTFVPIPIACALFYQVYLGMLKPIFLSLSYISMIVDIWDIWSENITGIKRHPTLYLCPVSTQRRIKDACIFLSCRLAIALAVCLGLFIFLFVAVLIPLCCRTKKITLTKMKCKSPD